MSLKIFIEPQEVTHSLYFRLRVQITEKERKHITDRKDKMRVQNLARTAIFYGLKPPNYPYILSYKNHFKEARQILNVYLHKDS